MLTEPLLKRKPRHVEFDHALIERHIGVSRKFIQQVEQVIGPRRTERIRVERLLAVCRGLRCRLSKLAANRQGVTVALQSGIGRRCLPFVATALAAALPVLPTLTTSAAATSKTTAPAAVLLPADSASLYSTTVFYA